ncbi:Rv3235 family protein [Nocardioides dubius]|uniref:Uncharacterized protein n=1 Tax=Nocardioides dubius TaxID=317019 RepID=A0ABP4EIH5_9ACTN
MSADLTPRRAHRRAVALAEQATALQGTLALVLPTPLAPPPAPAVLRVATAEPDGAGPPMPHGADAIRVSPALRAELHRWANAFVQACVETILGERPVSQLVRWTTPEIHEEIAARAETVAAAAGSAPGLLRARRVNARLVVSSVHSCFLATDRVEVCAVVRHASRSRCVAARMEKVAGRWQCTQIRFG